MNRIEKRLQELQNQHKKALITYMTAGLPDMEKMKQIILAQQAAGTDIVELGVPFSDPTADGPVIQAASYRAISKGVNITAIFRAVEEMRNEGVTLPLIFMMYYNTVLHYGVKAFVEKCEEAGIDGLIIPDLPLEEQGEINGFLNTEEAPILIQLVSPVSGNRIPMILENARGFVYCVSSMGVTGQPGSFHKEVLQYLNTVKKASKIPVMMGFGIQRAADVAPMKETIDGAIVGSYFINLMENSGYDPKAAGEYCSTFKRELNESDRK